MKRSIIIRETFDTDPEVAGVFVTKQQAYNFVKADIIKSLFGGDDADLSSNRLLGMLVSMHPFVYDDDVSFAEVYDSYLDMSWRIFEFSQDL